MIYASAAAIIEGQSPAGESRMDRNAASRRCRGRFENKKCAAFAHNYSIPGEIERAARLFGFLMKADYTGRLQLFQKRWVQRCFRAANKHRIRPVQKDLFRGQADGHGYRRFMFVDGAGAIGVGSVDHAGDRRVGAGPDCLLPANGR